MFVTNTRRIPSGSTTNGAGFPAFPPRAIRWLTPATDVRWTPAVDVGEDAEHYRLVVDLPGVDPDAITLTIEDRTLVLKGDKPSAYPSDALLRGQERRFGAFERRVALSTDVDRDQVTAHYDRGVLTIMLPKAVEARPRRIPIATT